MANLSAIKLPNGTTYNLKDNGALQLTGGQVTGPVTFGDSVSIDDLTAGQLVVEGSASVANNLQANTINGVTVGSSPKFTDTITTVSTTGSGNAITAISASNGALTATKGTTFLTAHNTYTVSTTGSGNAVTAVSLSGTTFTVTKGATYSNNAGTVTKVTAGTGLSIGTTAQGNFTTSGTINHTNSVTAQTTQAVYPIKIDAQGHISGYGSAVTIPTKTSQLTNDSGYITNAGVTGVKGNSESTYRTGQVNLTAANIGAVATSGNETVAGNKTFSGTTSLTAGSVYPANKNDAFAANATAIIQSPFPKYLWHDLFAFCRAATPTYYTTTNGSTWTAATLEKRLFAHQMAWGRQEVISSTIKGSRWIWTTSAFSYSSGAWLLIGVSYTATNAKFDISLDVEDSSGNVTNLLTITNASYNSTPVWFKTNTPGSTAKITLTILRNSADTTTNALPITSIRWLASRWGDQGLGEEYELPFIWDASYNISPLSGAVFKGNLTGDVTGNVSGTAGGVAWSNVSSKPTATGSSTTGITASTTANKTTVGSHSTDYGVKAAGSGSFTSGAFSGGSGSFSATVSSHVLSFSHTHTAATHAADSHTHTAPTLGSKVPTVSTASATVSITDPGHTHTIS